MPEQTASEVLKGQEVTLSPEVPTRPNLRLTHPNLYRALMTDAAILIALAANFLLSTPTFNPFDIHKEYVGTGFLIIGLSELVLLNFFRSLIALRVVLMISITYLIFWGIGTTQSYFDGRSSLQLFILYFGLASIKASLLLEPFSNPATATKPKLHD